MWMSLAPFWIADISIRFTSRMTGASPPCFSSEATSICSISSSSSTSSSTTGGGFLEGLGDHLEGRGAVQVGLLDAGFVLLLGFFSTTRGAGAAARSSAWIASVTAVSEATTGSTL